MPDSDPVTGAANPEVAASLKGKRAAVILYSLYLIDPRPRRAAEAMKEAGMDVDVLCISESEHESPHETVNGITISRLPLQQKRNSKWAYIWQYSRFFAASFWFLSKGGWKRKYDVVHIHNMPDVLVFSAIIPKLRGAGIILDLHDPMPELMMNIYNLPAKSWLVRLLRLLERWSIRFSDVVFTPNITFKNVFVSRSCAPEKMHIVMNSPLPEMFNASTAPESPRANGTFRLMHHGTILHRHGIDILVEAVARLRTKIPGIRMDFYGLHNPVADSVLALVRELQVEDIVGYGGVKSQAEIAEAIRTSDLGIVPNRHSVFTELNFPTRIFEYLAMNRPVIVPATRGITDYFKPDEIIMFEAGNVEDLAAKILWVWENKQATAKVLERGVQVYRANLWTDQKQRLLECTAHVVGR